MADDTNAQKIHQFNAQQKASGAQAATPQATPVAVVNPTAKMSVNDIQLLLADPATLSKEDLLRRQALATKENLRIAEEEKKKLDDAARKKALEQRDARKLLTGEAVNLGTSIADRASPVGNWLASKPTPGGIATLLILICVFLIAIVPVNAQGDTRLKLLWLTLTGKTHIDYTKTGQGTQNAQNADTSQTGSAVPPTQQSLTQGVPNYHTTPGYTQPTPQPTQPYTSNMGNVVDLMFGLSNM
jgi:hypothetical protein